MAKFTIEEHEKRMRELLVPKTEVGRVDPALDRLKEAARKRRGVAR